MYRMIDNVLEMRDGRIAEDSAKALLVVGLLCWSRQDWYGNCGYEKRPGGEQRDSSMQCGGMNELEIKLGEMEG